MAQNILNYIGLCLMANREPDSTEFLAGSMLGIEPDWYKQIIKEND